MLAEIYVADVPDVAATADQLRSGQTFGSVCLSADGQTEECRADWLQRRMTVLYNPVVKMRHSMETSRLNRITLHRVTKVTNVK